MLKTRPQNKTSAVKSAADEIKEHTRIAKILYENHNDTRYNQTTGRFEDFLGNKVEPQEYIRDQKKLQKSVDSLSPHKDYYYDPSTQQFEHKDRPPPHVLNSEKQLKFGSAPHRRKYPEQYKTINELEDLKKFQNGTFKEPTIGTALHRKKYPERYGYKYTSKLDQAAYPKAGTAPSEQEIQKRLDRARGPSDWDLIKSQINEMKLIAEKFYDYSDQTFKAKIKNFIKKNKFFYYIYFQLRNLLRYVNSNK